MKKLFVVGCLAAFTLSFQQVSLVWAYDYDCDNEEHPDPECDDVGSSVKPSRGEKQRHVTDIETFGAAPISFTRIYNSRTTDFTTNYVDFGWRQTWQHNWNYEVRDLQSQTFGKSDVKVRYPNGNEFNFKAADSNGVVRVPPAFHGDRLYKWSGSPVGHTLVTPNGWEYDFQRTTSPRYRLERVRNGEGLTWTLSYDGQGKLRRIENDFGRWLEIDRAISNNVLLIAGVRSSDGREVLYDYEPWANTTTNFVLTGVNYPDGAQAEYTYIGAQSETNGRALVATASDPKHPGAGARIRLVYNYDFFFEFGGGPFLVTGVVKEERNLVTDDLIVTLPDGSGQYPLILQGDGAEITRKYTNGLLREKRDAEGRPTFYTRDQGGTGYIGSISDAESNTTTFERDFAGRVLQQIDALGFTNYWSYNAAGYLTNQTDKLGRTTTYTRSTNNLVTRIDHPDGSFEERSYSQFGQVLTNRWRNGGVEAFTYYGTNEAGGMFGDLKTRADPMGNTQTYTWQPSGLMASLVDARNNITHFSFDWRGNLLAQTNADGTAVSYQYDAFGNRTNIINELGHTTAFTFDGYNRAVTTTDPLGRVTEYEYGRAPGCGGCGSPAATITRLTMPDDKITEYSYDHSDKRTNETIAAGTAEAATTSWAYDSVGRLMTQTDANGNLHAWAYDPVGRVVAETNAAGDVTVFAYDAAGNLTNRVDGAGEETFWTYDAMNRVTALGSGDLRYEYEYDLGGRRTAMHTRVSGQITETTAYTYDLNDRLLSKEDPTGYVLDYAYDSTGNRTNFSATLGAPEPGGGGSAVQISYSYDSRNRLVDMLGNGKSTSFGYDAAGRRTNAVWPNGTTATYTYDNAHQLLSLVHAASGAPLASFEYGYDLGGNRTNMTTLEGLNAYGYDNRNWLTSAAYPDPAGGGAGGHVQEFEYDPLGNRVTLTQVSGLPAGAGFTSQVSYTYGPANRLLSSSSPAETNQYFYDGAGRLTNQLVSGQARHYAYSFRGQMTELVDMDERVFSYDFDGDGNRLSQSLNDCLATRFVYDGPNVVLDLNASCLGSAAIGKFGLSG
jgi:YD repeat-containing protein